MESGSEFSLDIHQLCNGETGDANSKLEKENGEHGHVTSRHGGGEDRSDLLNKCKRESLALDSVYRYASKIKSFLGWEDDREDSERSEGRGESDSENIHGGHYCKSEVVDEVLSTSPEDAESGFLTDEKYAGEVDQNLSSDLNADSDDSFLEKSYNIFSNSGNETDELELSQIDGIDSDFDSEENLERDTNSEQKVFLSEISITVAERGYEIITADGNLITDSCTIVIPEMDESLVHQESDLDEGLDLNDVSCIIGNESQLSSAKEDMYSDGREENTETDKNIVKFASKEIVKNDKMTNGEHKNEQNLVRENSVTVDSNMTETCAEALSSEKTDFSDKTDKTPDDTEDSNMPDGSLVRTDSFQSKLNYKSNSDLQKEPFTGNDKIHPPKKPDLLTEGINKPYGSLKASVHHEKEKMSSKTFNDVKSGEKQQPSLKDRRLYEEDTVCGLGCFKPHCLQSFATPKMYVILYSLIGILHGSYYSYLISTVSTLEKRFAFKSKISGVIMIADEVTPLLLGVILGYYAGRAHRPRMVAFGMLLSAGCCFCSTLPYFMYGPVHHLTFQNFKNHTGPEYCDTDIGNGFCDINELPPTVPAVLFLVLGSFLKGFGNLAYYAIGLAYLDDNSDKKSTPIYLAISLALRLLGPLVGFLMSSAFLKIYENPFDDPGFGPDDPRWIGAWWMGFFLQGVLLLIFTIPIALFPRRLPGQKRLEKPPTTPQSESIKETLAGLLLALKRLGRNPIFIIMIINTTMKIFGHFGHSIMLPKYMENQFRLSAADASLFSGATSIFCIMIATIFGGFMIWKFRPRIKLLLAGMVVSEVMLCIGFLILMIPRCQPADLSHFGVNDEGLILNSVCNQNCDCSKTSFTPFCGPDGKTTYFSPCYAGCTEELAPLELAPLLSSKKQKEFGNCSCLNHVTNSSDLKITEGFCPDDNCWSQALAYLIILFILLTLSNTFTVAHTMILLRSVDPSDKSVALGTFETCICLFGFIPFPVTFGALVDSACLIWEESCGETGNCWFYDMERFAFLLHGASAIFCSLSVVCLISIYVLSSRIKNLYEEEEEQNIDNIKLDTTSGSVTAL